MNIITKFNDYTSINENASYLKNIPQRIYDDLYKQHIKLSFGDIDQTDDDELKIVKDDLDEKIKELLSISEQKTITLYRVIWCKDINDINTDKLGIHYAKYEDTFEWNVIEALYDDIQGTFDIEDAYIFEVEVPTNDIDYETTLHKNIDYPYEDEITLKTDKNVNILNSTPLYE